MFSLLIYGRFRILDRDRVLEADGLQLETQFHQETDLLPDLEPLKFTGSRRLLIRERVSTVVYVISQRFKILKFFECLQEETLL